MKNFNRYYLGAVFGMCGEYLYRVEVSIYPIIIMILITAPIVYDLTYKK